MRSYISAIAIATLFSLGLTACGDDEQGPPIRRQLDTTIRLMEVRAVGTSSHSSWKVTEYLPGYRNHDTYSMSFTTEMPPVRIVRTGKVIVWVSKFDGKRSVEIEYVGPLRDPIDSVVLGDGKCIGAATANCGDLTDAQWNDAFTKVIGFARSHGAKV